MALFANQLNSSQHAHRAQPEPAIGRVLSFLQRGKTNGLQNAEWRQVPAGCDFRGAARVYRHQQRNRGCATVVGATFWRYDDTIEVWPDKGRRLLRQVMGCY